MSLFKVIEFWSSQAEDDEYDQDSLLVTQLNCDSDLIVTGGQSGVLRIYKPDYNITTEETVEVTGPQILLIEKLFDAPILQVGCGRLVSGTQQRQLALLHPRTLSICGLRIKDSTNEQESQYNIDILYEHQLNRLAANFVIGPFGGTQNRDFICVESLDGMLSFFEQESPTFNCCLPTFLIPGPIVYIKKTDSFVTYNSNWVIEAYKYKTLSEADEKSNLQKIVYDWYYNIGEGVLDMNVLEDPENKESLVMILGERNIYCLNDRGNLRFMKRFEYSPIGFTTYLIDRIVCSLVLSETQALLIYHETTLKWSAKLHFLPVCIRRAFLQTIKGALVLLSEDRLGCCYLGTEPSLFIAPNLNSQNVDFDQVSKELEEVSKAVSYYDIKVSNPSAKEVPSIAVQVDTKLIPCTYPNRLGHMDNPQMCCIIVEIEPLMEYHETQITISALEPLKITPQVHFFSNLNEKTSVTSHVYLYENVEVPSLKVDVITTIVTNLGMPRCFSKTVMLPLKLVADIGEIQKDSEHKITLNINEPLVPLPVLFEDFFENANVSSAVAFSMFHNPSRVVTVLTAKSSERYRIQSDSFAALGVLIEQIIHRLKLVYAEENKFKISPSGMPANEFIRYVRNHFRISMDVTKLQNDLCHYNSQYRHLVKRLCEKLRSRNPTKLDNLKILLDDTYEDIIKITNIIEAANDNLCKSQIQLTCCLHILENLIQFSEIDETLKQILLSVFSKGVDDLEGQGWEDVLDINMCYLLRTHLAKSDKDKLRINPLSFEEIRDITKVEKHISQVIERSFAKDGSAAKTVTEEQEEETKPVVPEIQIPVGSQFAVNNTRLLSARKRLEKPQPIEIGTTATNSKINQSEK